MKNVSICNKIMQNFGKSVLSRKSLFFISRRNYLFFKKETIASSKANLIKKVQTPKGLLVTLVAISWVFLFRLWWNAEELVRERAADYYSKGGSLDQPLAEEYRSEYIEKQKRVIKAAKRIDNDSTEITIITKD